MVNITAEGPLARVLVPTAMAVTAILAATGWLILIALPLIAGSSLFLLFYDRVADRESRKAEELDELSTALRRLYGDIKEYKMSLVSGMEDAFNKVKALSSPITIALAEIKERVLLGQDLPSAIEHGNRALSPESSEILTSIGKEYAKTGNLLNPVKSGYQRLSRERTIKMERKAGSNQKYLTISMVFSTILPCLFVFAFIGYSIISYSELQFLLFSTVILSVLPAISSVIRLRLNENSYQN